MRSSSIKTKPEVRPPKPGLPFHKTPSFLIVVVAVGVLGVVMAVSSLSRNSNDEPRLSGTQTATVVILPHSAQGNAPEGHAEAAMENGLESSSESIDRDDHSLVKQERGSIPSEGRVKYKIDRFKKLALQPLEFEVFDEAGKAYKPADLQLVHEKKLHFIVVSANLKEFLHLHPDFIGGKWKVMANLPNPGTYYAYINITPLNGDPVVLRTDLIVRDPTSGTISYPEITPDLKTTKSVYTAQLAVDRPTIYQQSTLSFQLTANNTPVKNLQNYLGALGHVVLFRQGDPDSFMHIHPLSSSDASKGLAEFITTFGEAGRYIAFAEFKLGIKVHVFPIVFEVKGS